MPIHPLKNTPLPPLAVRPRMDAIPPHFGKKEKKEPETFERTRDLPKFPASESANRLLTRRERRLERQRAGKKSRWNWITVPLLTLGILIPPTVEIGEQVIDSKITQLQREYKEAGPEDGALLQAGDAAHGLLIAAGIADKFPPAGYLLRKEVKDHKEEWLAGMPEEAREAVEPVLDAFINGKSQEELAALIARQASFSVAGPSHLKDINEKSPAHYQAVKKLILSEGAHGLIADGDSKIHYWYVPAAEGKPTILFSNGRGATLRSAARLMLEAHNRGYGFMIYEYPQNGDSTGELSQDGYHRSAETALRYLFDRGISADQIINTGYSMGTHMAAWLGHEHPELENMVLVSAPEGFGTVYDDVKKRYAGTFAAWLAVDSSVLDTFNSAALFKGENGITDKNIVFFYGEDDDYVKPEQSKHLATEARRHGNDVTVKGVPGQSHSSIRSDSKSVRTMFDAVEEAFADD